MADSKDSKSNMYAAASTAAAVSVKKEAGLDSMYAVEAALRDIEVTADEVSVIAKPKTTRLEKSLEKLKVAQALRAAADEKAAAESNGRMKAVEGQPGHVAAMMKIVAARFRVFHELSEKHMKDNNMADPYVLTRVHNAVPKGESTGSLAVGKINTGHVSPYVHFKDQKCSVVGHVESVHVPVQPPLGQTAYCGSQAAYNAILEAGPVSQLLTPSTIMVPVIMPDDRSKYGHSASLGVTFALNSLIYALLVPADKKEFKEKQEKVMELLVRGINCGIQKVTQDGKETDMVTANLVGLCELLFIADCKTMFHFWYRVGPTPKGKPDFYKSSHMVGGVFAEIYSRVQQAALIRERSSVAASPAVPVDATSEAMLVALQNELRAETDKRVRAEAHITRTEKDQHANMAEAAELKVQLTNIKASMAQMATNYAASMRKLQAMTTVLGRASTYGPAAEAMAKAAFSMIGMSNLVSTVGKLPAVAGAAAAATAAAPVQTPAPAPAAASSASGMTDDDL